MNGSRTLSERVRDAMLEAGRPMSAAEIAAAVDAHRNNVYLVLDDEMDLGRVVREIDYERHVTRPAYRYLLAGTSADPARVQQLRRLVGDWDANAA